MDSRNLITNRNSPPILDALCRDRPHYESGMR